MSYTRNQLIDDLHSCFETVHEGAHPSRDQNKVPRALFWEYVWDNIDASDDNYSNLNTYQVSIFHTKPPRQNDALIRYREMLRKRGLRPVIYHEYNEDDRLWHSYLSLVVAE